MNDADRLAVLVNNAGIGPPNAAVDVTELDFDHTVGRVINLSSQAGFIALPTESVCCMTKAAISHLTMCLAAEWAAHGITVIAVAPTFIRTPGAEKWLKDECFKAAMLAEIPVGRVGGPSDVTAV